MGLLPTVKVKMTESGKEVIVNKEDYDPDTMRLVGGKAPVVKTMITIIDPKDSSKTIEIPEDQFDAKTMTKATTNTNKKGKTPAPQ